MNDSYFSLQAGSPIGPVLGDWNITVDVTGQIQSKRFQVNKVVQELNSLTRCLTEVPHLPRRANTEIRTSDAWPTT